MNNIVSLLTALEEREKWTRMGAEYGGLAFKEKADEIIDCIRLIKEATDGMVLVPIEPTSIMSALGAVSIRIETTNINKLWITKNVYKAMIADYKG